MNQNKILSDAFKNIEILKIYCIAHFFRLQEGSYIQYTMNEVKQLIKDGVIPKEIRRVVYPRS